MSLFFFLRGAHILKVAHSYALCLAVGSYGFRRKANFAQPRLSALNLMQHKIF